MEPLDQKVHFLLSSGIPPTTTTTTTKFILEVNLQTSIASLKRDGDSKNTETLEDHNQPQPCNVAVLKFSENTENRSSDIIFPELRKQLFFDSVEKKNRCQEICQALIATDGKAYSLFREKVPEGSTILASQMRQAFQVNLDDDEPEDPGSEQDEKVTFEDFLFYFHRMKSGEDGVGSPGSNMDVEPFSPRLFSTSIVSDREGLPSAKASKELVTDLSAGDIIEPTLYGGEIFLTARKPCALGTNMQCGFIWLTEYRLIFVHKETHNSIHIPVALVWRASKDAVSVALELYDNRRLKFTFINKRKDSQCLNVTKQWLDTFYQHIERVAFPGPKLGPEKKSNVFAFSYKPEKKIEDKHNGWKFYNSTAEYKRLGLLKNKKLRLTKINSQFELCPSYPQEFVVPKTITDDDLKEVALFRSRGRIPAIVYEHPDSEAFLVRCAQPLAGVRGHRNDCDEKMVKAIRLSTPFKDSIQNYLHFIDCRPYITAAGNMCMGKGFENLQHYEDCDIHFCKIDNIHKVRDSLTKLSEVCAVQFSSFSHDDYSKFHRDIASSDWLYYVGLILTASVRQANLLTEGESVVCHCSDGWDRTSQCISLTKLLLDPYFRTQKGFAILIEQEWLAFGHKFAERSGHGDRKETSQRAPIFTQWVDCVWQIWRQFPQSFEFSEEYLIALVDELYSCRFGTFLFDNVRERQKAKLEDNTVSLWSELCHPRNRLKYYNPLYSPKRHSRGWMFLDCSALKIRLWERLHLRYNWASPVQESNHQAVATLGKKNDILQKKNDILREKLIQLGHDVDGLLRDNMPGNSMGDIFHDTFHQHQRFVDLGGSTEETAETKQGNASPANRHKAHKSSSSQQMKTGPTSLLKRPGAMLRGLKTSPRSKGSPTHSKNKKGVHQSNSFTNHTTSVASALSSTQPRAR